MPVATLGEVNMGSPKELLGFLTWAAERYPAKRYLIVFNSHGSGTLSWTGPGSANSVVPQRFSNTLRRMTFGVMVS